MNKDRAFKSIETLKDQIDSMLDLVSNGNCSLDEMDLLLSDIRELEERIIVIRYKAMERISATEEAHEELPPVVREPELPLDMETLVVEEEDTEPKQISLIDSIEEISREVSVNENHIDNSGPSLAEKLEAKPIQSIMKALSINQKMGIVNQIFKGDDELFKATIEAMDNANGQDEAKELMSAAIPEGIDQENPLVTELQELTERRFL
jgi:hypothetical protein